MKLHWVYRWLPAIVQASGRLENLICQTVNSAWVGRSKSVDDTWDGILSHFSMVFMSREWLSALISWPPQEGVPVVGNFIGT